MSNKKNEDLQKFIDVVKTSLENNGASGIENYLLCGMADDYNYNRRLTPEIFFENNFYVEPCNLNGGRANKALQNNYEQAIQDLIQCLNNDKENFAILSGPAGSGKSTFITGFSRIVNKTDSTIQEDTITTIRLDCASNSSNYSDVSMKFPMVQLVTAYNSFYEKLKESSAWQEKYNWLLSMILDKSEDYIGKDRGYAEAFILFLKQNKITDAVTSHDWIASNRDNTFSIENREFAISLLILMLSCKIAVEHGKDKFITFLDNLEMYIYHTDQPIYGYISIAKNLNLLFSELQNILGADGDPIFSSSGYMTHFTFVLCLRTTTRVEDINYLDFDGVPNQWQNDKVRVINFPTYDFSPQALQNKLRFLKQHEALKPYFDSVLSYVKPLYDIDVDEPIDDDVAFFSSKYYFPFNNCNYRIAMIALEEVSKYKPELEILEMFLNYVKSVSGSGKARLINYIKNGKRMIATRSRYEYLNDQGYLQQVGIMNFDTNHHQSNARAILNYIVFKGKCDESNYGNYRSVSFLSLKNDVQLQNPFLQNMADAIIAMGPVSSGRIREETLRKWGALVHITGIESNKSISEGIRNAMTDDDKAARIQISLTPAGNDYVLNESEQFEYFLFRILNENNVSKYKPLYSYLHLEDTKEAIEAIGQVYLATKKYIEEFNVDCPSLEHCGMTDCPRCFSKSPMLCMTIVRAFDFFAVIRQHINYIDRYRCVLVSHLLHTANHGKNCSPADLPDMSEITSANDRLVNLLASYIRLYDNMAARIQAIKIKNGNLYDHILTISDVIAGKIESNDILPIYHLPSRNNPLGYPFCQGRKNLTQVLNRAKSLNPLSHLEPTKLLYQIMDEENEAISRTLKAK